MIAYANLYNYLLSCCGDNAILIVLAKWREFETTFDFIYSIFVVAKVLTILRCRTCIYSSIVLFPLA